MVMADDDFRPIGKPQWLTTPSYGIILIIISAMSFSVMSLFLKLASSTGVTLSESMFIQTAVLGIVVVFLMTQIKAESEAQGGKQKQKYEIIANTGHYDKTDNKNFSSSYEGKALIFSPFGGTWEVRKFVIIRGTLGGVGLVIYYYTLDALRLGDAVTLLSLNPVVTIFWARLLLDEAIEMTHVVATFLSVVGAVLITRPPFIFGTDDDDNDDINPWGYLTAVLGVLEFSMIFVLVRKAGKLGVHTLQLLFSFCIFSVFFSIMFGYFMQGASKGFGGGTWSLPTSMLSFWYLLLMTTFGSINFVLLNYAGRFAPAGLSAIAKASDIMWSYLFQVLVFGQIPTVVTYIGVVLATMSVLVIAFHNMEDKVMRSLSSSHSLKHERTSVNGSDVDYGGTDDVQHNLT